MAACSGIKSHHIFHLCCLLIACGLASRCVYKFLKNDNLSIIEFKKFHLGNLDRIYPSISICVINPFLDHELERYGEDINVTSYSYFLQGLHWDKRMLDIDFDNVTISLDDNLKFVWLMLHNSTQYAYNHDEKESVSSANEWGRHPWVPKFYVSFRSWYRKCFTFDIPFMKGQPVFRLILTVKNSFFPQNVRPTYWPFYGHNPEKGKGFMVYFHYPGQHFTSVHTVKYDWKHISNYSNTYRMDFGMSYIEMMRRRNRPQHTCIEDWRNYDQIMMDDIMLKAGCRPPHWTTSNNFSLCSKREQMTHFENRKWTEKVEAFGPPCKVIERLQYSYNEDEYEKEGKIVYIYEMRL